MPRGVTIETLMQVTGWKAHSVCGFLSGITRKKLGFKVLTAMGKGGERRYPIARRD